MHFTIITPSYNQLDHLKRCLASVRDQISEGTLNRPDRLVENVEGSLNENPTLTRDGLNDLNTAAPLVVHHHIQDAGSTDGTVEWLGEMGEVVDAMSPSRNQQTSDEGVASTKKKDSNTESLTPRAYSSSFASEADEGMYDAINKGVAFALKQRSASCKPLKAGNPDSASSDLNILNERRDSTILTPNDSVVAWLNCDEQYLPGTLEKVATFFKAHPDVDILFGSMLMVDEKGELLSCRKAMPMRKRFLEASYLYNYSCAMFFRESLWKELGGFDTSFKNAGDEDLIRRAIKHGARSAVLNDYLATFTYSDTNLSSDPVAVEEHERLKQSISWISRIFRLPINLLRLAEKFLRGGHVQRGPLEYELYQGEGEERTKFESRHPSCRWPDQKMPYLTSHRLKNI